MFTDMTDTMLKVLDRRMAATAQARELENTLAEKACALGHNRQTIPGYLPDPVICHSLSSQPLYMTTLPRTTNVSIPIAVSTPVPQMGPTHFIDLFLLLQYVTFWTLWQLNKLEPNI